ncbi:MAG: hypothetical protein IJ758_04100 [Clostridia bacterium]|nr:hypothetical protein [Clostridia bacterium]
MIVNLRLSKSNIMKTTFCIAIILSFFSFSRYATTGAKIGLNYCLETLIPSILPFMIISLFTVNSGVSEKVGKVLSPFTTYLFDLPGCAGAAILIGLIGGYPTGANGVVALYKNRLISRSQAEKMSYYTVAAGPAFIINVIGETLLNNRKLGMILFFAHVIPILFLGVFCKFIFRDKKIPKENIHTKRLKLSTPSKILSVGNKSFSDAIIVSSIGAYKNMLSICTLVILSSSLLEVIQNSRINAVFLEILRSIGIDSKVYQSILPLSLEITRGSFLSTRFHVPLPILSFFLAWGGVCVQMQIFTVVKTLHINKLIFMLFRFFHGVFSYFLTYLFLDKLELSVLTSSNARYYHFDKIGISFSFQSIILVIFCILFLFSVPSEYFSNKKYINHTEE